MVQYWQRGESLDYRNKGAAPILYGDVISLITRVGIAGSDIPPGATGSVHLGGIFIFPKGTGLALALGEKVYWNEAAKQLTTNSGDIPAGWVVEEAVSAATEVKVKLEV